MNKNENATKGLIAVVIAVVLFLIGCWDRIEIIGQYKCVKQYGEKWEDRVEDLDDDLKKNDIKLIVTYGPFGGYSEKYKLSDDAKDALDEDFVDQLEEHKDETKDSKWKLSGSKIKLEDEEGDTQLKEKYKAGFTKLEIGKGSDKSVYNRTFLGYICPSVILKIAAVAVLAYGVMLILKKDEMAGGAAVVGGKHCTNCGAPLDESATFCTSCGTPVGGVAPAEDL